MNEQDCAKMIYSIARKYSFNNDFEDLCQVGQLGLIKAYDNFKEGYGIKFSSYAYTYILGEILKYVRENRVIKISKDIISLNKKISNAKELLAQKMMRVPTDSELALFLEIPEEKIRETYIATEYVKSLDYESNDEGKELTMYDLIQYEEKGYNDDILDLKEELNQLDEEERKLIIARYYHDKSQQETSKILGISQVQVSRCESKILTKLKSRLAS